MRFFDKCEVCYACLHNCPQTAIHMPVEAGAKRFRNDSISLAEFAQTADPTELARRGYSSSGYRLAGEVEEHADFSADDYALAS